MPRASIAAKSNRRTKMLLQSCSAETRKSEQTADDHARPEDTANTNSGKALAHSRAGHSLRRHRASVAHGRDEECTTTCRQELASQRSSRTTPRSSQSGGTRKTVSMPSSAPVAATGPAPWLPVAKNFLCLQLHATASAGPCIFHLKSLEQFQKESLMVVVEGCGQVGRGPRGGQCEALSTASGPVRAAARTVHLSTASRCGRFRGRCANPDRPLNLEFVG